jgi:hypothetical protein
MLFQKKLFSLWPKNPKVFPLYFDIKTVECAILYKLKLIPKFFCSTLEKTKPFFDFIVFIHFIGFTLGNLFISNIFYTK